MRNHQILSVLRETAFKTLRAADQAVGQLYFDFGHNHRDTVILAGSARGGTTWVAELVNFDNSYRLIFEPLSHYRDSRGKFFLWGRYLRTGDHNPSFLDPVRTVVSGRYRNGFSDRLNRQMFPHRRLIKDVGVNLLLHWLYSHFPEIPLVLLLRHPCAVIHSRRRIGWPDNNVSYFLRQESLMSDFLFPYRSEMENATPFEAHLMHWCIETLVPLKQFKPGQFHLAFYENFRIQPRLEIQRLFAFLQTPLDERVFTALERPSKQTRLRMSRELHPTSSFDNWRQHFSDEELRTAQDVLRRFGLDSLYQENGMPNDQA